MMSETVSTGDVFLRCFQAPTLLWDLCMIQANPTFNDLKSLLSPYFPNQTIPDNVVNALLNDLANTGCRIWLQSLMEWVQSHPAPQQPVQKSGEGYSKPPWG